MSLIILWIFELIKEKYLKVIKDGAKNTSEIDHVDQDFFLLIKYKRLNI